MDGEAPVEAGAPAEAAPDGPVQGGQLVGRVRVPAQGLELRLLRDISLRALVAEPAGQALGDDAVEGAADEEGLDAHLDQTGGGRGGVVGVQGGEHEVPGEGGLDGDGRRLPVADLTQKDDVRVRAQDGAQGHGEVQPRLDVDLHLVDSGQPVLDGVLDRDDVLGHVVDCVQRRVERGRLARARRPGDEDGAIGLAVGGLVALEGVGQEAQVGQVEQGRTLVEDPHDHLLAVDGREGGDTKVDGLAGDHARHAPVLGHAALGDVEVGHDLQAADQPGLDVLGRAHHLMEHAVDAVPDPDVALGGLDVDVGGAVLNGLADQEVDELDDRGVLDDLADMGEVVLRLHLAGGQGRDILGIALHPVMALDRLEDGAPGGDHGADVGARDRPDVVDGHHVGRVGHGDDQAVLLPGDGDGLEAPGQGVGDETDGAGVDGVFAEVDELQADARRQRGDQVGLGDHALVDEDAAERLTGLTLF